MTKRWLAVASWAGVIFFTSCFYIPSRRLVHSVADLNPVGISEASFSTFWRHWWWAFVKGYHVLEYTILTGLVISALTCVAGANRRIGIAGGAALLFACSDEWHQTFVRDRGGTASDVAIDSIGIALVVLWFVVAAWRAKVTADDSYLSG
ncbi:MAG: VanZ family protein [Fimbriimonas ginsengisoli]|uniref:VanZ family protein n=1 Tax=Fimbriimonas ginsengisoli TaxID=1005039 RepID=A0A931PTF1_FIMGI|nr:VanZ family protein [Fimbriimonas ginsengisoli]